MSENNVTMTERERVLELREAFVNGVGYRHQFAASVNHDPDCCATCKAEAATRYPLPKLTQPRVVADPHSSFVQHWRVRDGRIEWEPGEGKNDWRPFDAEYGTDYSRLPGDIRVVTPERIKVWADLLATPNELVEADADSSPALTPSVVNRL